jgi:WD40 repeat protein
MSKKSYFICARNISALFILQIFLFLNSQATHGQGFEMVVQNNHTLFKAAISNDGQVGATTSQFGGEIKIYDLNTNYIVANFPFNGVTNSLFFTRDKKYIIAAGGSSRSGKVLITEIVTKKRSLITAADMIIEASLSPDEKYLVTVELFEGIPNNPNFTRKQNDEYFKQRGRKIIVYHFPSLVKYKEIITNNYSQLEGRGLSATAINNGLIIRTVYTKTFSNKNNFYHYNFQDNKITLIYTESGAPGLFEFSATSKYLVISRNGSSGKITLLQIHNPKKKIIHKNDYILNYSISENESEIMIIEETKNIERILKNVPGVWDTNQKSDVPLYYHCLAKYNIATEQRTLLIDSIQPYDAFILSYTSAFKAPLCWSSFKFIGPCLVNSEKQKINDLNVFTTYDLKNKTKKYILPPTDFTSNFHMVDQHTMIYGGARNEKIKTIIIKDVFSGKTDKMSTGKTTYTSRFTVSKDNKFLIGFNAQEDSLLVWNLKGQNRILYEGRKAGADILNSSQAAADNERVKQFSENELKLLNQISPPPQTKAGTGIEKAVIDNSGNTIIASDNSKLYIWDTQSKKLLKTISGYPWVNDILIIDDKRLLIAQNKPSDYNIYAISKPEYKYIRLIDRDGNLLKEYLKNSSVIPSISFNKTTKLISAGYIDTTGWGGVLISWDLETARKMHQIEFGIGNIPSVQLFDKTDKKLIAGCTNGEIHIYDAQTFQLQKKLEGHSQMVLQLELSEDERYLYSAGMDKKFIKWDMQTGEIIYTYVNLQDPEKFFAYTPDGYFDCSSDVRNAVAYATGFNSFGPDQFAVKYNRPDIVLERMGCKDKDLIAHYKNQYLKRLRRLGMTEESLSTDFHIPQATIIESSNKGKFTTIKFRLSDEKYALKSYNIFVNDIPLYGESKQTGSTNTIELSETIELCNGTNKIEVSCLNEKGAESYRAMVESSFDGKVEKNLYLLAFGVSKYKDPSFNLMYAHKDALDLANILEGLKGRGFDNIYTKVLVNEQVTPEAIRNAKEILKNSKPDDTFILYIAGHGVHDKDAESTFYYLTYNTKLNDLKGTAADFETIEDLLRGIPPRNKLFLMDACESGELDLNEIPAGGQTIANSGSASRGFKNTGSKPKIKGSTPITSKSFINQRDRYIYNDLVRRSGAIVFSSSKGGEVSYERSDIENGLFTEYIMKALSSNEADNNTDGIVSTDELRDYVNTQVARASGDLQHPTVDRDNIYQKFGFIIK